MVILPEIPQGRRTSPWRRQMDVVERILTHTTLLDPTRRSKHQKEAHNIVNKQHRNMVWYARCGMRCICMIWQEMHASGLNLEIQVCHWKDEMKSLENDIKTPESELRFGKGKRFKYDHVLRFTASSHQNASRWICYSTQTWQQNTWQGSTHHAWQKMNTKLRRIHPLTGSNKHGKSAIGKQVSDLVKFTQAWNFRSGSTLWSMKTRCYRNLTWKSKAWHGTNQIA